jgi:hypothetical protein
VAGLFYLAFMPQRARLSTGLSGVSGEYLVAAELSRRGFVASLTLKNTRGIDILASNLAATKQAAIQVKTEQGSGKDWMLTEKAESVAGPRLFYVFVRLHGLGQPDFYIVPSRVVARFVRTNHRRWLRTRGVKGQAHKDTPMRKFRDDATRYKDAWHLLGLGRPAT